VRFAFIAAEKAQYPVSVLCRCLGVTRSGFYAWQRRPPSLRSRQDIHLLHRLRLVHAIHRRLYGRPRLHRALRAEGIRISPKRVARLMRAAGLRAEGRRAYRVTTDSAHAWPIAANYLHRRFAAAAPHQRWAADITALPTHRGWCYLAVIIDVGSRRVVGWAIRSSLETELVLAALHVALGTRPQPRLHHSDRGAQYASYSYRAVLEAHGIRVSMSRVGNCWDNAIVESFFSSLKAELVSTVTWTTHHEAGAAVASYIRFYNQQRLHSALDYRSPAQYESQFSVAV
jgi:transposase InsO family protein